MTSQPAYDRYNARYNNAVYLAATEGMTIENAIALQDTALDLCEYPHSILAVLVAHDFAEDATNAKAAFLALFIA